MLRYLRYDREAFAVKNLVLVLGGAAAAATLSMGTGSADPASNSTYNVVGEPYAKAVAILRAQGVPASFGGSVGSEVPQSQCVVSSQKVTGGGKMQLMLNCTAAAQPEQPAATPVGTTPGSQSGSRPTAGAPGVVSVVPVPVG